MRRKGRGQIGSRGSQSAAVAARPVLNLKSRLVHKRGLPHLRLQPSGLTPLLSSWARDSLSQPAGDGSGEGDGAEAGMGASVVAHGDAAPVLEPSEHDL